MPSPGRSRARRCWPGQFLLRPLGFGGDPGLERGERLRLGFHRFLSTWPGRPSRRAYDDRRAGGRGREDDAPGQGPVVCRDRRLGVDVETTPARTLPASADPSSMDMYAESYAAVHEADGRNPCATSLGWWSRTSGTQDAEDPAAQYDGGELTVEQGPGGAGGRSCGRSKHAADVLTPSRRQGGRGAPGQRDELVPPGSPVVAVLASVVRFSALADGVANVTWPGGRGPPTRLRGSAPVDLDCAEVAADAARVAARSS